MLTGDVEGMSNAMFDGVGIIVDESIRVDIQI